jgi:hypothetical protein
MTRTSPARARRGRPRLEWLEERCVPATFVVNSTADLAFPPPGAPPGVVTLRFALTEANADTAPDTITFDPSLAGKTITLSLVGDSSAGPSALAVGAPGQLREITIDGSPAPGLTVSGPAAATNLRLVIVLPGNGLTLEDLTLSGGQARGGNGGGGGGGAAGMGGAVFNEGTLTVRGCTFTANLALGGSGGSGSGGGGGGLGGDAVGGHGGPPNGGAAGTFGVPTGGKPGNGGFGGGGGGGFNGTFPAAGGAGGFGGGGGAGGVFSAGPGGFGGGAGAGSPLASLRSGLLGVGGGGAGMGGAIFNDGGNVSVLDSTFTGNTARGGSGFQNGSGLGGAVFSRNGGVAVSDSTLFANAADAGGGLYAVADGGPTAVLVNNTALAGTAGGSDFQTAANGGQLTVGGSGDPVQSPGAGAEQLTAPRTGLAALLGSLQNNGGPTPTLAPLPGSPLLNAGDNAAIPAGLATDQRGLPRVVGARVDVGAVEAQTLPAAVGVFDPTTATWFLHSGDSAGPPDAGVFRYGVAGWLPVAGDWQGSAQDGIGVFDPSTATWYLRNELSAGAPDAGVFQYGFAGVFPVAGDWSGSGQTGIGIYDPSTQTWYLRNEANAGAPDAGVFRFGVAGVPVVGDWTGTGHLGIGVFDPRTFTWFLRSSATAGPADVGVFQYGGVGAVPVAGDWTGVGHAGVGVLDPSTGTWYLRSEPNAGAADAGVFAYGAPGWLPVVGAFPAAAPTPLAAAAGATPPRAEGLAPGSPLVALPGPSALHQTGRRAGSPDGGTAVAL